jgi:GT2 family glycosyltransferase
VYRTLPGPAGAKVRLKDAVYTILGAIVFRGTPSYAAWRNERSPVTYRSWTADEAPADWPSGSALAPADGRWEWADYELVRSRIADVLRRRGSEPVSRPRPLIRIDPNRLREAARSISLPAHGDRPRVSVIVPAYGQARYTVECLLSIAAAGAGRQAFEVIVADDASPDDTQELLQDVQNLRLIRQPENIGFIKNCNSAAAAARGSLIVFLNNDTQVQPGWLDAMVSVFDEEEHVGAVGPRLVFADGHLQDAGGRVRRQVAVELLGLNGSPTDPRWIYRRDVDYISGACVMIDADVFRELGGFDVALAPAYCEDLELGLRLAERGLRSVYVPDAEVVHHLSVTSRATDSVPKMQLITRNFQTIAERHQGLLDALDNVRLIAFYLPQYYPFDENDRWWGQGFTDWQNVTRARPNWAGHYQPRVPADLGYYDLRVPETMDKQWQLAERYGVDGFCYYYYWFAGTRLLDRPLDRLLSPDQAAHPFCLCWANENWTRRWDGQDRDILIAQRHSADDDIAAIRDIARYISHPAYIRVRGRPLVLVYRVDLFPDFRETAARWRAECQAMGLGDIELAMVESFRFAGDSVDPTRYGCDAAVEFPAHHISDTRVPTAPLLNPHYTGSVADYVETAVRKATRPHPGYRLYRSVMPGWDNTARRQDTSFVLENSTPGAFQAWLETAIEETKRDLHGDQRLVFINAWNEWAEAAYLEPDERFGHAYLEAVRNARDAGWLGGSEWQTDV